MHTDLSTRLEAVPADADAPTCKWPDRPAIPLGVLHWGSKLAPPLHGSLITILLLKNWAANYRIGMSAKVTPTYSLVDRRGPICRVGNGL